MPKEQYYYGLGLTNLVQVKLNGTICLPIQDDRGTIVGVVDAAGNIKEKLFYNSIPIKTIGTAIGRGRPTMQGL